jgi:hypothetical protein
VPPGFVTYPLEDTEQDVVKGRAAVVCLPTLRAESCMTKAAKNKNQAA